ncbi:uncharacterized protein LOC131066466 isoform X1 [Cryptomeria japonica]|uniref:uncharacterized protein LOC131066466 isoform X1 n=2 Tax=Cryptomeria japonica TaxID=3369 RepID=UPI0027DA8846|nr:uncharacterized protein LOC131066466 isoform X1 [Cryptomeria japonica]
MAAATCPFCEIQFPLSEIEWHVNSHLDEDEFSRDRELAVQLASSAEPPLQTMGGDMKLAECCSSETASEKKDLFNILDGDHIYNQVSCLISCQTKSNFYRIEEGLMNLLRKCLEAEHGLICCAISGHIDHFQSTRSEDLGWGCGWRNIQMLSSHLLMQVSGAREMLFGGSGFIPDIPSLQRWLEIAWQRGFDMMGAQSFNFGIYGSKKWIGTTECAALLRSFGLRARIVDFGCEAVKSRNSLADTPKLNQAVQGRSREMLHTNHTNGPLNKFLHFEYQCDGCKTHPIRGSVFTSRERENFHVCSACMDKGKYLFSEFLETDTACSSTITNNGKEFYKGKPENHQVLVDWVWNYFVEDKNMHSKVPLYQLRERIITSQRTPLYFQHNGHSRTIVGIQRRYKSLNRRDEEVILLVLDPAQRTEELARALRGNSGWQKLVKRGLHTLRKPEYQLCYVDLGIAHGEELEQLKILDSEVFKY